MSLTRNKLLPQTSDRDSGNYSDTNKNGTKTVTSRADVVKKSEHAKNPKQLLTNGRTVEKNGRTFNEGVNNHYNYRNPPNRRLKSPDTPHSQRQNLPRI